MIRLGCDSSYLGGLIYTEFLFPYADLLGGRALAQLQARFPGSVIVPIDRGLGDPLGLAGIIDVERFARTPADAPVWFDKQHAAGFQYLTVYASLDKMAEVAKRMGDRKWWRFYAYWQGGLHVAGHTDAMIQFASGAELGAPCDLTLVHNDRWHPQRGGVSPQAMAVAAGVASQLSAAHRGSLALLTALGAAL